MTSTVAPIAPAPTTTNLPSLEELWMPFTANRAFKKAPVILTASPHAVYCCSDRSSSDDDQPAVARRAVDALYRQPRVQESAKAPRRGQGHVLHRRRWPADPRRDGRPLVRERRPLPRADRGRHP